MCKKILGITTIVCLLLAFSPNIVYAENSLTAPSTDGITGYTEGKGDTGYDYIYLGNSLSNSVKWRVLSDQGNATGDNDYLKQGDTLVPNDSALFLLTDDIITITDKACQKPNYQDSDQKQWCDSVLSEAISELSFDETEKNSFLNTFKDDLTFEYSASLTFRNVEKELNGDRLFLLSGNEVTSLEYGFGPDTSYNSTRIAYYNGAAEYWVLRQANTDNEIYFEDDSIARVSINAGKKGALLNSSNRKSTGLRPAVNLYKDAILFSSAAENGKGDFGKVEENTTHEWKLTLKDDSSFVDGASIDLTSISPGKEVAITHKKLSELSADYTNVTAAISDKDGNLLYYGSVDTDVDATETKITIPADLPEATYTLSVYGEDWNGNKFTDYATGTPFETELVVDSKAEEATTEPTTEPSTEPATEPTTQPSTKPSTKPATNPTTESSTKSTSTPKTTPAVKVGTAVTVGNLKYKITSVKANNPTVTITGMKNKKKTSVKIPATIKNNKVTYKVTAIANNAFKGNKKLKSVTIGKNVKSLGKNVFRGCKKLKKITIKTKVLKKVGAGSLKGIHKKAVIKVPAKKKKAYKKLFKKKGQAKTVKIK